MKTQAISHTPDVVEAIQNFGAAHPLLAYALLIAVLAYCAKWLVGFIL